MADKPKTDPRWHFVGALYVAHDTCYDVHRAGCKDIRKTLRDLGGPDLGVVQAPTREAAVALLSAREEFSDPLLVAHCRWLPCCPR